MDTFNSINCCYSLLYTIVTILMFFSENHLHYVCNYLRYLVRLWGVDAVFDNK